MVLFVVALMTSTLREREREGGGQARGRASESQQFNFSMTDYYYTLALAASVSTNVSNSVLAGGRQEQNRLFGSCSSETVEVEQLMTEWD